jgi:hypothetical protein
MTCLPIISHIRTMLPAKVSLVSTTYKYWKIENWMYWTMMGLTCNRVQMDNEKVKRRINFHKVLQSEGYFDSSEWYTWGQDGH